MPPTLNRARGFYTGRPSDPAFERYRCLQLKDRKIVLAPQPFCSGSFGHVYLGYDIDRRHCLAVKLLHLAPALDQTSPVPPRSPHSKRRIERSPMGAVQEERRIFAQVRPHHFVGAALYQGKRTLKMFVAQTLMLGTLRQVRGKVAAADTLVRGLGVHQDPLGAPSHLLLRHFFAQVADDLAQLHRRGLCHNDIKDDNVFICQGPEPGIPRFLLGDFGMTCRRDADDLCHNVLVASPEAAAGQRPGCANDIWGLGLLLMRMVDDDPLSGTFCAMAARLQTPDDPRSLYFSAFECVRQNPSRRAYPGVSASSMDQMRSAWRSVRALPPPLAGLIYRMLDPQPLRRPTAADLAAALRLPNLSLQMLRSLRHSWAAALQPSAERLAEMENLRAVPWKARRNPP